MTIRSVWRVVASAVIIFVLVYGFSEPYPIFIVIGLILALALMQAETAI
jgi:hypothetical protein